MNLLSRVQRRVYSIGIIRGGSPLTLLGQGNPRPALTCRDVTDAFSTAVADPFMLRVDGAWHMFFEAVAWRGTARKGEIAHATSKDGLDWEYDRIVLAEPFHMSYPYTFQCGSDFYMVPETHRAGSVRLYRADPFPTRWVLAKVLMEGPVFLDSSIVERDGHWYMFSETSPTLTNDTLRLFHAPDLQGPWTEHPASPVVERNARIARPAGRIVNVDGKLLRFAQDCTSTYGEAVCAFEVTRLDPHGYAEQEVARRPILGPGGSWWDRGGMHHLDAHQLEGGEWIACVDGWRTSIIRPGELVRRVLRGIS